MKPAKSVSDRAFFCEYPVAYKHWIGGDPKEGALFYEESSGKFDSIPVK